MKKQFNGTEILKGSEPLVYTMNDMKVKLLLVPCLEFEIFMLEPST